MSLKNSHLHRFVAGLAAAALLSMAACGTDETTGDATSAASTQATTQTSVTTSEATTSDSTSEPGASTSKDPTSSGSTSAHTDESLAAILSKVTLDGDPITPIPIATVRGQSQAAITVKPEACQFAAQGLLPLVMDGTTPAALALPEAGSGITIVALGTEEAAKKVIADRDALANNPACAKLTVTAEGTTVEAALKSEKSDGFGMDDPLILVSTAAGVGDQYTFTARKGDVVVSVSATAASAFVLGAATAVATLALMHWLGPRREVAPTWRWGRGGV